jgi:hypothetical protein
MASAVAIPVSQLARRSISQSAFIVDENNRKWPIKKTALFIGQCGMRSV